MSNERWLNPRKIYVITTKNDLIVHLKPPNAKKPTTMCGLDKRSPGPHWRFDPGGGLGAEECRSCVRAWQGMIDKRLVMRKAAVHRDYLRHRAERLAQSAQYWQQHKAALKRARGKVYDQEVKKRQARREARRLQAANDQRHRLAQDQELPEMRDAG